MYCKYWVNTPVDLYLVSCFYICLVLQQLCGNGCVPNHGRVVQSGAATLVLYIEISSVFQQETHTLLCLGLYGLWIIPRNRRSILGIQSRYSKTFPN